MNFLLISSVVLAFIFGLIVGKVFFANRSSVEKELKATKEELDELKNKIKHHFSQNVMLFKQFDDSYQKLFKNFGDSIEDLSNAVTTFVPPKDREYLERTDSTNETSDSSKNSDIVQPKDY